MLPPYWTSSMSRRPMRGAQNVQFIHQRRLDPGHAEAHIRPRGKDEVKLLPFRHRELFRIVQSLQVPGQSLTFPIRRQYDGGCYHRAGQGPAPRLVNARHLPGSECPKGFFEMEPVDFGSESLRHAANK